MIIVVYGGEKEINIYVYKNDCLSFICLNEYIGIDMIIVEYIYILYFYIYVFVVFVWEV